MCDEMDFTPPHIGAVLHPALEDKGSLYIPETGETIFGNKGFMVIATANTGGKGDQAGVHAGAEVLNIALTDRYPIKLTMDYLPKGKEFKMMKRRFPEIAPQELEQVVALAVEIREAFKAGNMGTTFPTRKLVEYGEMHPTFGPGKALSLTVLNWLDSEDKTLVTTLLRKVGIPV